MKYLLIILIGLTLSCGKSDILPDDANIGFTENRFKVRGEYDFLYYEGKLRNNGDLDASLVWVTVRYYDSEGFLLDEHWAYASPSNMNGGDQSTFSVYIGDAPDDVDDSKTQTFVEWINRT